jgi:lysophospholipase L1-like esterase
MATVGDRCVFRIIACVAGLLLLAAGAPPTAQTWVGTWEAAPVWANPAVSFTDTTLREIVHVSIGGTVVRVRLSNTFGSEPLAIGHATIAIRAVAASPVAAPQPLTFGGATSIQVPPGAQVISDATALNVAPGSDLLISLYLPGPTGAATEHPLALQTNFSSSGDHTVDANGSAYTQTLRKWYFLSGVDIAGTRAGGAVVTLGDSITDGAHSLVDENGRWPDVLARRIVHSAAPPLGVLNAGISGGRILLDGGHYGVNALARLNRDVLAQTGVRDVIVLLGINDLEQTPQQVDPLRIEAGLLQIAERAHERRLRVLACTILPSEGYLAYNDRVAAAREAVNAFIRTSKAFDGVCDFDAAVRDPRDPMRMLPAYDSGDHLHPNSAGLQVMGSLIDISELQ